MSDDVAFEWVGDDGKPRRIVRSVPAPGDSRPAYWRREVWMEAFNVWASEAIHPDKDVLMPVRIWDSQKGEYR